MIARAIGWRDPAAVFPRFAEDPFAAWLDGAGPGSNQHRYSYIVTDPFSVLRCDAGRVTLDGAAHGTDPFAALADALARFPSSGTHPPVPFAGGAVGFLGYELAPYLDRVPRHPGPPASPPDMVWTFHDVVLAFDHAAREAWVISSGLPEAPPAAARRAERRAAWMLTRLEAPAPPPRPAPPPLVWVRETSRARHAEAIGRIREHIGAGDIFQANYTNRFIAARPPALRPADVHAALRARDPAPFAAFLDRGPGLALASLSPERFLSLDANGMIETRPIKGTRPRGATPEEDAALAAALRGSAKDGAENLMIVDLLRNDIGRVARIGSVDVPALAELESFGAVHHLVSVVRGRLRPGLGPVDLLRATFPGGSVTGAPKVRAMEIITAMEDAPRGPYCGAIGWIGWNGAMDTSIVIRTAVITDAAVIVQAGGGIVWDSDPAGEYAEMMTKAGPLLRALGTGPD